MSKIIQIIVIGLLGIGLLVVAFTLANKYLSQNAIDKCLAAGRDQFVRDGHTLTGPDGYWYNFCKKEKGIK